ncbi:SPOR domain-containing protein [Roseibacterium sp. SDUM158017]|uniref:SPOR domain-containing protein n=1 Tax=Roseicyclus salinarum TaxID=3036773 RepID=UPI0024154A88|nr:SPOR domain-containing protein [Roseibacterium sp. SDUM158017]MDG4649350.1 SPOR domain-containing protein [Roseibacterium sp. SDUM158017]
MTHTSPLRIEVRRGGRIALTLAILVAASACTETGEFSFGTRNADAQGPAPIGATPLEERDVEAPEIFDVTEEGLWDGRPSLGGVWVAHPDAADPERVIIRNSETGRFVIGALFRRERENPGPVVQISSDAAAALDILAGAPTMLQVTALRREEVPQEPESPSATEDVVLASAPGAETVVPDTAEPQAGTVSAADAPATAPLAEPDATLAASAGPTDAAGEPASEAPRARRGLLARIFSPAPAAARTGTQAVAGTGLTAEEVSAGIRTGTIETERLDPIAAVADAAIAESEATEVAAAAPARPAPTAAAPRASALDRPFVQIGIFNMQENAHNTGQALRNAGLLPTIYDQTSNGRRFWRVVVGPAPNAADRSAVLETVRGLGFEDAYYVTR